MARKTKDEAEKTRNKILDAAECVFFARGVSRTTFEEIAAEADVTRGAVYWHFENKKELCHAMAERVFLPHEDMLDELDEHPSENPIEDLRQASLCALHKLASDKRRRDVVTILTLRCEYVEGMQEVIERSNQCMNRMLTISERLFSRAKRLNLLAKDWTPRQAAVAVQALITGIILGVLEQRKGFSLSPSGLSCINTFFRSLQAK